MMKNWEFGDKTGCMIAVGATGQVHPSLMAWLEKLGIPLLRRRFNSFALSIDQSYSIAAGYVLESTDWEHIIFADADMQPSPSNTNALFDSALDIAGVRHKAENPDAFNGPDAFHCGIWRMRRSVLKTIWDNTGDDMFQTKYHEHGRKLASCPCSTFAGHARRLGFTVGNAGYAEHVPKTRTIGKVIVYDSPENDQNRFNLSHSS